LLGQLVADGAVNGDVLLGAEQRQVACVAVAGGGSTVTQSHFPQVAERICA
jgi:hypothetical protein